MIYDVFYMSDPEQKDPSFEWIAVKKVNAGPIGSPEPHSRFWHCLVHESKLDTLPVGSIRFSNLPPWAKQDSGASKHYFLGRKNILEFLDGGFDEGNTI